LLTNLFLKPTNFSKHTGEWQNVHAKAWALLCFVCRALGRASETKWRQLSHADLFLLNTIGGRVGKNYPMYKLVVLAIWVLSILQLQAQKGVTASGGDANNSTGSISYSVGQIDFAAATNATGAINAGIQQPYEVFVSAVDEAFFNAEINVFPNPADHYISLNIQDFKEGFSYQLFDLNGKLISSGNILEQLTNISMLQLPTATYLLNVQEGQKTIKSFKIVKR
jgi:hypothetical protein